ncbi:MAG: hypothetical protein IMZ50_09505 [Candidatus Atribacteria bacterium]|nr:hypothetical protein [Candidatus Atribacteria bacterium]
MARNNEIGCFCPIFYLQPIRAVDGDTFMADVQLGFGITLCKDVRLMGFNTPEILPGQPAIALKCKNQLQEVIDKYPWLLLIVKPVMADKHGRIIGNVFAPNFENIVNELDPQYIVFKDVIIPNIQGFSFTPFGEMKLPPGVIL